MLLQGGGREGMLSVYITYLIKDFTGLLGLFHIQGAKGDPWSSLGVCIVVILVIILAQRKDQSVIHKMSAHILLVLHTVK